MLTRLGVSRAGASCTRARTPRRPTTSTTRATSWIHCAVSLAQREIRTVNRGTGSSYSPTIENTADAEVT